MESHTGNYNDVDLAMELKEQLTSPERFVILQSDYEPIVTSSIIGNVDLFVGTKTHSIVYGLKSGVPTLSISYQQKANEFMEMFGVLEDAIDLEKLNINDFEEIFKRMLGNLDDIRNRQEKMYAIIQEKSLENKELLLELLQS